MKRYEILDILGHEGLAEFRRMTISEDVDELDPDGFTTDEATADTIIARIIAKHSGGNGIAAERHMFTPREKG